MASKADIFKRLARIIGTAASLPHEVRYRVGRMIAGERRAFTAASERIALVPGLLGVYTRQAFYRRRLASVGADVHFGFMSVFSKMQASLGDRVYIGRFCTVGLVDIEDDVMLADGVQVLSGGHQHGSPSSLALRDNPQQFSRVRIGRGAWIGAGAIVMADVGEGAIVAAGAVVTRPVAAGDKVAGVPAKPMARPALAKAG